MTAYAPSQYQTPGSADAAGSHISEEDLEKLQEIHELINLIMKELPVMAQTTARTYARPMLPAVPYTYTYFPWGMMPVLPLR